LGLVMRQLLGRGTPRGLQGYEAALFLTLLRFLREVAVPNLARSLTACKDSIIYCF
jgi:hypothetical protein